MKTNKNNFLVRDKYSKAIINTNIERTTSTSSKVMNWLTNHPSKPAKPVSTRAKLRQSTNQQISKCNGNASAMKENTENNVKNCDFSLSFLPLITKYDLDQIHIYLSVIYFKKNYYF